MDGDRSDMIMKEAAAYITERLFADDEEPFNPTWMLVAQWDKVHPHPHGSDNHEGIDEEYLSKVWKKFKVWLFNSLVVNDIAHIDI